jgi:hypothetical protein
MDSAAKVIWARVVVSKEMLLAERVGALTEVMEVVGSLYTQMVHKMKIKNNMKREF